ELRAVVAGRLRRRVVDDDLHREIGVRGGDATERFEVRLGVGREGATAEGVAQRDDDAALVARRREARRRELGQEDVGRGRRGRRRRARRVSRLREEREARRARARRLVDRCSAGRRVDAFVERVELLVFVVDVLRGRAEQTRGAAQKPGLRDERARGLSARGLALRVRRAARRRLVHLARDGELLRELFAVALGGFARRLERAKLVGLARELALGVRQIGRRARRPRDHARPLIRRDGALRVERRRDVLPVFVIRARAIALGVRLGHGLRRE